MKIPTPDSFYPLNSPQDIASQTPLVVDLDSTLCRTDTLWECFFAAWARDFFMPLRALFWLLAGRTTLKRNLASAAQLDANSLPWNDAVLQALRSARSSGRKTVLATAAHQSVAERCADSLQLFDEVFASDDATNLKGATKAAKLVQRFGQGGFDYIGDSRADVPVWAAARSGFSVSNVLPAGVVSLPSSRETASGMVALWSRALRLRHWVKNALVFVAILAAHRWTDAVAWQNTVITFVAFCAVCSSIYLLNDLFDLQHDRRHASKRNRPLAAGHIALSTAFAVAIALLVSGLLLAAYVDLSVLAVLATYCMINALYTLKIKRIAVADVCVLAALYTLRIVAGAVAIAAPLSPWLFAFSVFIFLSLALLKRAVDVNALQPTESLSGRGYVGRDAPFVNVFGGGAAIAAVLVLALYVASAQVGVLYSRSNWLWLALAVILFWLMRMWRLAISGQGDDDPVLFATRDGVSWGCALACLICFALAV
ncbi:MAG: UbiA family prenyltransferase [Betaproteobacteria bacterium]|nr:MAG: UbiA family prenyltransferase [Betaproteobacteria bacterium]